MMSQIAPFLPNNYLSEPVTIPHLFSPDECKWIRNLKCSHVNDGKVRAADANESVVVTSIRKTTCHYLDVIPETRWISQRAHQAIEDINRKYYHFRLSYLSHLQIMEYDVDGFYTWHLDIGHGQHSTRKLSFVVLLSEPDEYQGGRLQLEPRYYDLPQDQGTAFIFPSYLKHRVEPVLEGKRWSLVAWVHGPVFS